MSIKGSARGDTRPEDRLSRLLGHDGSGKRVGYQ